MKKRTYISPMIAGAVLVAMLSGCGGPKAPESVAFENEGYILGAAGQTYDLSEEVVLEGENVSEDVTFSTSDESIVTVSEDGILTAEGEGGATVTVTSAEDESVSATVDVLVYDFTGLYTAEKYIDAMGCDVRISFLLSEDGNFDFYRYPMNVALDGGGQMEGMKDKGTYKTEGNKIVFTPEYLKEFSLTFQLDENGQAQLAGDTPTGGATTEMNFDRGVREDRGENGVYTGSGESQSGEMISYRLEMNNGEYSLKAGDTVISAGTYAFMDSETEFYATEGSTFHAVYDAERHVVEGTEIPVAGDNRFEALAATLQRQ